MVSARINSAINVLNYAAKISALLDSGNAVAVSQRDIAHMDGTNPKLE